MTTLKRLVASSVFSLALLGGVQPAAAAVLTVEHTAVVLAEVVYEDNNIIMVRDGDKYYIIRKEAS